MAESQSRTDFASTLQPCASVGVHLNLGEKSVPFFGKTFFFGLHLICSPEQNRGRGSSPPMLKIGQNWDKIANYFPQCSAKIGTPVHNVIYR